MQNHFSKEIVKREDITLRINELKLDYKYENQFKSQY